MAKLALAVAILLSLFALSLARHVPEDLPNTETETLSLGGGQGHKPMAIRLPSETSSFVPLEVIPMPELPIDGPQSADADAVRPRVVHIEISFIPVNRPHVPMAGLPIWHPLGHRCRRVPHGAITRLMEVPRGVDGETVDLLPGGEHRLLQPVTAERMGVDVRGTGEISARDLVKETETEPPRELSHFAKWLPAEGQGGEGRDRFTAVFEKSVGRR